MDKTGSVQKRTDNIGSIYSVGRCWSNHARATSEGTWPALQTVSSVLWNEAEE